VLSYWRAVPGVLPKIPDDIVLDAENVPLWLSKLNRFTDGLEASSHLAPGSCARPTGVPEVRQASKGWSRFSSRESSHPASGSCACPTVTLQSVIDDLHEFLEGVS
jgi:hypothetical protein